MDEKCFISVICSFIGTAVNLILGLFCLTTLLSQNNPIDNPCNTGRHTGGKWVTFEAAAVPQASGKHWSGDKLELLHVLSLLQNPAKLEDEGYLDVENADLRRSNIMSFRTQTSKTQFWMLENKGNGMVAHDAYWTGTHWLWDKMKLELQEQATCNEFGEIDDFRHIPTECESPGTDLEASQKTLEDERQQKTLVFHGLRRYPGLWIGKSKWDTDW
ncbi:hypothetical protein BT96DRAFT_1076703 [Gymnopus androsaceus JB14]|uniref:Uncharacterized protein n=1 Tax=Gymnopus androsaceus JB14 TaxID=1447944 RepID=A0A6A4GRQ5_9AGAR|nr:hypothetical protein BT96DRAFT_1076703 [Gymnopus androsaceus JB14]